MITEASNFFNILYWIGFKGADSKDYYEMKLEKFAGMLLEISLTL